MGEAARGWLAPGRSGKVLAAVTHATYLLTEEGELVWLATSESPMHRRCIQWPPPLPRLAVDSTFKIRGQSINLESGTRMNFRAAQTWETPTLPVGDVIEFEQLPGTLFAEYESILDRKTPIGYGTFIRPVLQIARKQDSASGFQPENILTMTAWPIVERIARACLAHDLRTVMQQVDALIGLGEGLTPSGDDFLGGLFFARYLLRYYFPHLFYLEISKLPQWIDTVQPRTNLISFALLKDNIFGHALDPLNSFGVALLTKHPRESATSAASDLIKIGHSTGWSLLAGFLVGMLLAYPE